MHSQPDFFCVAQVPVGLQLHFDTRALSLPLSLSPAMLNSEGKVEVFSSLREMAVVLVCENLSPCRLPGTHGHSDLVQLPAFLWYELQLLMTKCMQRQS
jgi:hypothetical protein